MAKNGSKKTGSHADSKPTPQPKPVCGLVMPISSIGGCTEQHWTDVKAILFDVIESAEFDPNLVSDADDAGIIQQRIIQNLYDNPIVICDVSAKNPNVMFELGLRLAFDKPTIIVKDDTTDYSFDTAPIEHLEYPRDLRFNKIVAFKDKLKTKITGTHKKATEDPSYTTFLKHFNMITVAKLESKEVSKNDYMLQEIKEELRRLRFMIRREKGPEPPSRIAKGDSVPDSVRVRRAVRKAIGDIGLKPGASDSEVDESLPMLQHQVSKNIGFFPGNQEDFQRYFRTAILDYFDDIEPRHLEHF